MMYDRLTRVLIVSLALVLCGIGLAAKAQTPKPNIVIIVADDMGWNDVGYHGGIIDTPNLNRLADEGVRLENWHVMPLCSPTRAGFMTGRWPIRFGMGSRPLTPWWRWGMATTEHTIADLLGEAGYERRGAFGKWHLGLYVRDLLPLNRGFTTFYGGYNGAFDYFTHEKNGELDWHRDWDSSFDVGYSTDLLGQEAADFIADSPANEPFFLYVPFNAPHTPIQAKEEDIAKYAADLEHPEDREIYAAMVDSMDQAVGVILQALEDKNVVDNTFVLFFSDNGALSRFGDNSPWRGQKGTVYEGGVRTPALVRWPDGGISGPDSIDGLMGIIDVYPTLKALAGVTSEDPNPLDGIDLLEIMRGNEVAPVRDWFSYVNLNSERAAVSDDTWKLVVTGGNVLDVVLDGGPQNDPLVELFRIDLDLSEEVNLLEANPIVAAAMLERLQAFRDLKIDGIPDPTEAQAGFIAPTEWNIMELLDSTFTPSKAIYDFGEDVVLQWTGKPGNALDWIELNSVDIGGNVPIGWAYTDGLPLGTGEFPAGLVGMTSGSLTLDRNFIRNQQVFNATGDPEIDALTDLLYPIPAGDYVAGFFLNDSFTEIASTTFTVSPAPPPPAAITYDGDSLLSTGGAPVVNANLLATLRDIGGFVLPVDGEEVTFTLTAEGIETIIVGATTLGGVAETVLTLEPAVYTVEVTVAIAPATAFLVIYNPDGGFATGGGWIVPEIDGLNTYPNVRANFGFSAKYKQDVAAGHIEFRYTDGYIDLKSESIELLVITGGNIVQFKGWASVNGEDGNWFFVKAIDNGEPGVGSDEFEIKIWAPGVDPEGDHTDQAGGILRGGNIKVHRK